MTDIDLTPYLVRGAYQESCVKDRWANPRQIAVLG